MDHKTEYAHKYEVTYIQKHHIHSFIEYLNKFFIWSQSFIFDNKKEIFFFLIMCPKPCHASKFGGLDN